MPGGRCCDPWLRRGLDGSQAITSPLKPFVALGGPGHQKGGEFYWKAACLLAFQAVCGGDA